MAVFKGPVFGGGDVTLADLFPSYVPEPERLIYEYVHDASRTRAIFPENPSIALTLPLDFEVPPELNVVAGTATKWDPVADDETPVVDVVRGWPAFPAKLPAIGVALGPDPEEQGRDALGGEFHGDLYAVDQNGNIVGTATYYSEPLRCSVVVELVHENRDERDRLHMELRQLLAPLHRKLSDRDQLIHTVSIAAEKQELDIGEQPYTVYVSLFTLDVQYEMLQAVDVVGPAGVIDAVNVTVTEDPTIPLTEDADFYE